MAVLLLLEKSKAHKKIFQKKLVLTKTMHYLYL